MKLWIAEKPDAGRQIATALGGTPAGGSPIQCPGDQTVFWAIGHLLELQGPEDYDPAFKKWDLETLPIIPASMLRKPIDNKASHLRQLTALINKASEVVIATDPGREGEAIAWTILDHAKYNGPVKRLWTNALNPSALKNAIAGLIDDASKKPLYVSAKLRASIDWSDGINWSRYYGLRASQYGDPIISIGRVQTATLAILADRDLEHENFTPRPYFEVKARFDLPIGQLTLWHRPPEEDRIFNRNEADTIVAKASGETTTLKVEKKPRTVIPPTPFSLPDLQMACASRWNWSAKRTLDTLQTLYEAGLVTYPRTDTGYLPDTLLPDLPDHVAALRATHSYGSLVPAKPVIHKAIFDTSKTDDHHGIITTTELGALSRQSPDGIKLHDIIARRFIAALMPAAVGFTTTISAVLADKLFRTSGTIYNSLGWKSLPDSADMSAKRTNPADPDADASETDTAVSADGTKDSGEDNSDTELPNVADGTRARPAHVSVSQSITKPPSRFSEGSLIKAMMNAGAKSTDKEIRQILKHCGIGTKATRQDIIEKLKSRDYCRIQGKHLISTERGRSLIKVLRSDQNRLTDIAATAALEIDLIEVEKDASRAGPLWRSHVQALANEIKRLKAGPAPVKITTNASAPPSRRSTTPTGGARSHSASSGSKSGNYGQRSGASKGKSGSYQKGTNGSARTNQK